MFRIFFVFLLFCEMSYGNPIQNSKDENCCSEPTCGNDKLKSDKELLKYFSMYAKGCPKRTRNGTQYLKAYRNKYQHYVKAMTKELQIPQAYLACMIYKESFWNRDAESSADAMGLAQLKKGSVEQVKGYLNNNPFCRLVKNLDKLDETVKNCEKQREKSLKAFNDENKQNKEKLRNLQYTDYALHYLKYLKDLKDNGKLPKDYKASVSPWDPVFAVGASGLHLRSIGDNFYFQKTMNYFATENVSDYKEEEIKLWLTVSGAYNLGNSGAYKKVFGKNKKNKNLDDILKRLSSVKETRNYLESIRRCVTAGEYRGPVYGKESKSSRPCGKRK